MSSLLRSLCACCLLAGLSLSLSSRGADTPLPLAERIARPDVLRGRFEQDRLVVGFRKPLRSSGHFVLARGRGVLWWTEQPFRSSLIVTATHLIAETDGDMRRIDAADEPALRAINTLLFDVLGGDIARLHSAFVIEASPTIGPHWQLRLTPKPGLFAQVFSRIELQGERHVETVVLDERNGDRSTIRFRDLAEAPALSADEVVRLAQ